MVTRFTTVAGALALALAATSAQAADAPFDIKRGAPSDVHLAVYGKHNPEREYQWEYLEDAWDAFQEERIGKRIVDLIGSRIPEDKKSDAKSAWQEFKSAVEPFDLESLEDVQEVVVAQRMQAPVNHNLVLMRMPKDAGQGLVQAVVNTFKLLEEKHGEEFQVGEAKVAGATITTLEMDDKVPIRPAIALVGDVVVFSTHVDFARQSIKQMTSDSGESKFDDPRLQAALKQLPKAEDSIVFFDGAQFFESLHGVADFIRQEKGDDETAIRLARVFDTVIEHAAILDYEAMVEYTDEGQNRQAALGKLAEGVDQKTLGKALVGQQPFEDWASWVPADATSYSLTLGANPHVIYEGLISLMESECPEAGDILERFQRLQDEAGVHLDEDILQNISGECVTVTVPVGEGSAAKPHWVLALKVEDADTLRALITRGVEALGRIPAVQAQQVALADDEALEGFQQLQAMIFAGLGAKPVVGFRDGWMIVSSHVDAARKVVEARWGDGESLDADELLDEFGVEADGEVYLVSYADVGAGIRKAADVVEQIGTMATVFGGAALANAPPKDAATVREALGLLPSIAKVIRKFDFYEDRLSITQAGPEENTYRRDTVTNIRQSDEADDDDEEEDDEDDDADGEQEEAEEAAAEPVET